MDYKLDENYTVTEDNMGTKITHPAFGTVAFNRRYGGGSQTLFGSSIYHDNTIALTIRHADVTRNLNNDWYHGTRDIVEVEMSYSQFVEAITNMNSGTGIPCTIRHTEKDGRIPPCHFVDKYTEFQTEMKESLDKTNADAEQLYKEVKELFETKASISKKDRAEILAKLDRIVNGSKSSTIFTLDQFKEQMDKTVQEAKGEIEAFMQNKLLTIAQQSLVEHRDEITQIKHDQIVALPEYGKKEE